MRTVLALTFICLLVACSGDQVKDHYATRADAETDHLFERGWLPSMIPTSSFKITTENDLDLNLSSGEFSFDPAEAQAFINHLQSTEGTKTPWDLNKEIQKKTKKGYSVFTYTDSDSRWIFFVNSTKGHTYYDSWLLEKTANHVVQATR